LFTDRKLEAVSLAQQLSASRFFFLKTSPNKSEATGIALMLPDWHDSRLNRNGFVP
jgi:hypothetical protein